jgi:hypothetical protein
MRTSSPRTGKRGEPAASCSVSLRIASGWAWPAGDDDDDDEADDEGAGDEAEVWSPRTRAATGRVRWIADEDDAQRTSPRGRTVRTGATRAIQSMDDCRPGERRKGRKGSLRGVVWIGVGGCSPRPAGRARRLFAPPTAISTTARTDRHDPSNPTCPSTPTSAAFFSNMIGEGASWQHSLDVGVRLGLSVADASAAFPPGALAGWLFLLGVLLAAVLLFTMVFFVRLCLRTFAIGQRLTSSSRLHRRRSSCFLVRHSRGRAATGSAADEVALSPDALPRSLADLECDYVNPIDLSNKLNQVRPASRSWDSRSPHSPERAEPDTGATS